MVVVIILAPRQFEALKRSQYQPPSVGKLQGAGFNMRLRVDHHLLSAMPLDQQHAMTDLPPGHAIDGKVAEEGGGTKIGKRFANFHRIEAPRDSIAALLSSAAAYAC